MLYDRLYAYVIVYSYVWLFICLSPNLALSKQRMGYDGEDLILSLDGWCLRLCLWSGPSMVQLVIFFSPGCQYLRCLPQTLASSRWFCLNDMSVYEVLIFGLRKLNTYNQTVVHKSVTRLCVLIKDLFLTYDYKKTRHLHLERNNIIVCLTNKQKQFSLRG